LLDHRLVEYASALPSAYKIRGRATKAVFRAAVSDLLPADILNRAKRGFDPPLDQWFGGRLREQVREILLERRTIERGYFAERKYREYVEGALNGGRNTAWPLWLLLNLELWHREYVDMPAGVRS
jgi:asparagine synthase (glutamine-hydrolysing)